MCVADWFHFSGIVVQGPKTDEADFISAALSYDPIRNITSGFLGFTTPRIDEDGEIKENLPHGKMDIVMEGLCSGQFTPNAMHPLLLPTLILNSWCDFNSDKLDDSRERLWHVRRVAKIIQHRVEALVSDRESLEPLSDQLSEQAADKLPELPEQLSEQDVNDIHRQIQMDGALCNDSLFKEHSVLLNESFPFVEQLVDSSLEGLREFRSLVQEMLDKNTTILDQKDGSNPQSMNLNHSLDS
jgi:hypothetical protein